MVVDTGQGIPCFDSCLLTVTWITNIKDVPVVMVLDSDFFKVIGLGVWTYTPVRTVIRQRNPIF